MLACGSARHRIVEAHFVKNVEEWLKLPRHAAVKGMVQTQQWLGCDANGHALGSRPPSLGSNWVLIGF